MTSNTADGSSVTGYPFDGYDGSDAAFERLMAAQPAAKCSQCGEPCQSFDQYSDCCNEPVQVVLPGAPEGE